MAAPVFCPHCGSVDIILIAHTKLFPSRAEYVNEFVYLCDLGHMFTLKDRGVQVGAQFP